MIYNCFGIRPWKRQSLLNFLPDKKVVFKNSIDLNKLSPEKDFLIIWATIKNLNLEKNLKEQGFNYQYVEDGFIRSSGLGIKLNLPGSLSFSNESIHFDCTKENQLEKMLQNTVCTSEKIDRSKKIIDFIKKEKISKYGHSKYSSKLNTNNDKKNILVIGQVEGDASIHFGSKTIKKNKQLIESVLQKENDSNIFFKPHPDVVSKLREGEVENLFLESNNITEVISPPLHDAIEQCDEIHVMSSQSGLDSLIFEKDVICHGSPFYSGWGLTTDLEKIPRRTKKLTLEELISISFIDYPKYYNFKTKKICEIEEILDLIKDNDFKWPQAPYWMQKMVNIKRMYGKFLNG
jgi:capsular polysaccharide export protein